MGNKCDGIRTRIPLRLSEALRPLSYAPVSIEIRNWKEINGRSLYGDIVYRYLSRIRLTSKVLSLTSYHVTHWCGSSRDQGRRDTPAAVPRA